MNTFKIMKFITSLAAQIALVVFLTYLVQRALETLPVPDVFKNMSIIELDDLDRSIVQSAANLKTQLSNEQYIDSNIIILNTETISASQRRGDIAKAIRFLKDNGAKAIAMEFMIDNQTTDIDPTYDTSLASAIKYAGNVIGAYFIDMGKDANSDSDDVVALLPLNIFREGLKNIGYTNLIWNWDDPTQTILKFNPNKMLKGEKYISFPLAVAMSYDSVRASELIDKYDAEGINFYPKPELYKKWDLSYLVLDETKQLFAPQVKDRVFIIGHVNPEDDLLKSYAFNTPVGKLEYVYVYVGIISDILLNKFIPESPPLVDFIIGALFCLANLLFFYYASIKSTRLEKFTGALLIPIEIVIIYLLVMATYLFFDYKISVIIPSIVTMISIPFNSLLQKRIIPLYKKYSTIFKYSKYPFPLVKPYLTVFETDERSIKQLAFIHGVQRMFWLLCGLSRASILYNNQESNIRKQILSIRDLDELKKMNAAYSNYPLNNKILTIINNIEKINILNDFLSEKYLNVFGAQNLKSELYLRIEADKEVQPNDDIARRFLPIFKNTTSNLALGYENYGMIYITKGDPGNYLIREFKNENSPARFLKTDKILLHKTVYLTDFKDIYIPLTPYINYRMCKYHHKKELFIYAFNRFNEFDGKVKNIYYGDYFMCSPIVPPVINE